MNNEITEHLQKHNQAIVRMQKLANEKNILQIQSSQRSKETFGNLFNNISRRVIHPDKLMMTYSEVCNRLNKTRFVETCRTPAEIEFIEQLQLLTKTNFIPQVWIGNHCADYFCYSLGLRKPNNQRGFDLKGIDVEIDGNSHKDIIKQKKDLHKDECMLALKFLPIRIPNEQVKLSRIELIIKNLSPLTTHDRNRLKKKVALKTCLYNATDSEWQGLISTLFNKKKD